MLITLSTLKSLNFVCDKHGCSVLAYVLMTNHVHLHITPHQEQNLGKAMQMQGRYYLQYYNYCYRRTGTLGGNISCKGAFFSKKIT
jgi:putative transposase